MTSRASPQGNTHTVTLRQELRAPARRIWAACTEPAELSRWQVDRAEGAAEPGGSYVLSWPALGIGARIDVQEVDVQRRLVLRHGTSDVTFSVSDGALEVSQSGLPDPGTASGVASSWRLSLAVLAHYLTHHEGRDRRVSWHVVQAPCTPAAAHVYFTDAPALAVWLTRSGGIGQTGTPVRLELAWLDEHGARAATCTGRVLANTPGRDLALSWEERSQSVIALRTLPAPLPSEHVIALSWSRWGERGVSEPSDATLDARFAAALGRLQRTLGGAASA